MTFYPASFETVTLRFILMMAVIIVSFTTGFPIIGGILGLTIFLSALMAVSFKSPLKKEKVSMSVTKSDGTQSEKQAA